MGNELFFEGKKYISARRASQITGYNSDYIGQLCRKGSLECRLVGRSWFVEEKSLENHKVEASKTPRGRIPIYLKNVAPVQSAQSSAVFSKATADLGKKLEVKGDIKSLASDAPTLEALAVNAPIADAPIADASFTSAPIAGAPIVNNNLVFRPYEYRAFLNVESDKVSNTPFARKITAISTLIVLFIFSATFYTREGHIEKIDVAHKAVVKISRSIDLNTSAQIASAVSSIKNSPLGFFSDTEAIYETRLKTHKLALKTYHYFSILPSMIFDTAHNMKKIVMNEGEKIYDYATTKKSVEVDSMGDAVGGKPAEAGVRAGITVVPSSGDAAKDEKIKQYIKDSFSDETQVLPDDTGTSGVIKPVFKKQSDEDYLYVIVPVKD